MTASRIAELEAAWQELCERDDRTSPAERPDMCLITREELADFMLATSPPPAALGGEPDAAQKLLDKALTVLGRCHTVLFNMAKENEGAIFNRWPIHHEPLRSDARNLLPLIDEVLGDD